MFLMNYETSYNFCFPSEPLWQELVDAQAAKDGLAIQMIVQAQYDEIGPDVTRSCIHSHVLGFAAKVLIWCVLRNSRNAMHFIAYRAIAGYLKYVFNSHARLPHGETVGYEIDLWADNFGDGRVWPGVHTRRDHAPFRQQAEALGVKIAKEHLAA